MSRPIPIISVVLPTYNPDDARFAATLAGLRRQCLVPAWWELLVVDNNSSPAIDETWCEQQAGRQVRVVREPQPGLSHARLAGIRHAGAEVIVFCDDDNVLAEDYLERALSLMSSFQEVGVAGGRSLPEYLAPLPGWYVEGIAPLGCRDLGDDALHFTAADFASLRSYPDFAPIGAGMVFRKAAMEVWSGSVGSSGISDRKGKSLSSAGDCDMVLHALAAGYDAAYWPDLTLTHLMPAARLTEAYLGAISRAAFRDFVKVLDHHGIRPWPAISSTSLPLRVLKAWWATKAWRGPLERIRWQSAVGQFEGRSQLD